MRITEELLNSSFDTEQYVQFYLQMLHIFEKNGATFFGGVVRELMVPLMELVPEAQGLNIQSVRTLLERIEFIDLMDIDIWLTKKGKSPVTWSNMLRMLEKLNEAHVIKLGDVLAKSEMCPCGEHGMGDYSAFKVDISSEFHNNATLKLDFSITPSQDNIDFDVNNLAWSRADGFSLVDDRPSTIQAILGEEDESQIPVSYFGSLRNSQSTECILKIVDQILSKKCLQLKLGKFRRIKANVLIGRLRKMNSKGYSFTTRDFDIIQRRDFTKDVSVMLEESKDCMCGICMMPEEDTASLLKTRQGHFYHPDCMFTWWKKSGHEDSLVRTCPLRNQLLIWE